MEGTKAGVPNVTKSVSTAAHCYICAAPGTCRDGAEEREMDSERFRNHLGREKDGRLQNESFELQVQENN
ncbi:hypothetical protein PO909_024344 [Leuciscus waleckii]